MLQQFVGKKVLVLGDFMLDKYLWGDVRRISEEAPVPVVRVIKNNYFLGGAGNVCATITALNGQVFAVGLVGEDDEAEFLKDLLQEHQIITDYIVFDKSRPTTKKTRVLARNQLMLRLDYESYSAPSKPIQQTIISHLNALVPEVDIVVVSDRGKGLITRELMYSLTKLAEKNNKKIIVDPFPKHKDFYMGVSIVTPAEEEARKMADMKGNDPHNVEKMGEFLTEYFNAHVLIRRDLKGIDFFNFHGNAIHIPSSLKEVVDITGNRDVLLGTLALAVSSDLDMKDALKIASAAADITMSKIGTYTPTIGEIESIMKRNMF